MTFEYILKVLFSVFSGVLLLAFIDFYLSLRPLVHKNIKSKTVLNMYDLLYTQATQLVKSNALNQNIAISETKSASINDLSKIVAKAGFTVSPETIARYVDDAITAYKAEDGKFVQTTVNLNEEEIEKVFSSLVANNLDKGDIDIHNVATVDSVKKAPAPSASVNGSDHNAK